MDRSARARVPRLLPYARARSLTVQDERVKLRRHGFDEAFGHLGSYFKHPRPLRARLSLSLIHI